MFKILTCSIVMALTVQYYTTNAQLTDYQDVDNDYSNYGLINENYQNNFADDGGYNRNSYNNNDNYYGEGQKAASSYGGEYLKPLQEQPNLAQGIPQVEITQQTLDEIYSGNNNNNNTVLYFLKFANFSEWNPRSSSSSWQWDDSGMPGVVRADNALFQVVGTNDNRDPYGSKSLFDGDQNTEGWSYTKLYSLPFASTTYEEGSVKYKGSFSLNNRQRILTRWKFSCQTVNVEQQPFGSTLVTNAQRDPRLAFCAVQVIDTSTNAQKPLFFIRVTNGAVWADYIGTTFAATRLIGVRERYDSIIDAGIETDGQGVVRYYLNGYLVWTINALNVPPLNDGITKVDYGRTTLAAVIPLTSIKIAFGTGKRLDRSNPFNQQDTTRLVQMAPAADPIYAPNSTFYDSFLYRGNVTWGQGAVMTLYKLVVIRTELSAPTQPAPLPPAVYGPSAAFSLYQRRSSNMYNIGGNDW